MGHLKRTSHLRARYGEIETHNQAVNQTVEVWEVIELGGVRSRLIRDTRE
jgi:hypothetical protein